MSNARKHIRTIFFFLKEPTIENHFGSLEMFLQDEVYNIPEKNLFLINYSDETFEKELHSLKNTNLVGPRQVSEIEAVESMVIDERSFVKQNHLKLLLSGKKGGSKTSSSQKKQKQY